MKRVFFATLALLCFILFGCNTKHLSIEQSKDNFIAYQHAMETVANQYGAEIEETDNTERTKDLYIKTANNATIMIRMENGAYDNERGVESFSIDYMQSSSMVITVRF